MAVISIFSGVFCKAAEVSVRVAEELGYPFIEEKLFAETSARFNVSQDKLIHALTGPEPFLNRITHEREKNLSQLRIILSELIQSDNIIIQGCAVHLIPRTIGHALRVCLIASHDFRIQVGMAQTGKSEKEINKELHEDDKKNFACSEYLSGKTAYDESLYDIMLPMHDRQVEEAVNIICDNARSEPIRTTERSRRAAQDFILSAQINMALSEAGLSADVHSESGQVILSINDDVVRLNKYREKLKRVAEKVSGVKSVSTRLGPRYKAGLVNPWANIEGPPKFMLVDDEKEFVHTLSERLRTRDLESSIAYDGEQALDMIKQEVPDVIVLDLMMPGIDGIDVLRHIKSDNPEIEVIILTGHGSDREKRLAEELGAFAYLNKPVDIDILARVMRDAYARTGSKRSDQSANPEADKRGDN